MEGKRKRQSDGDYSPSKRRRMTARHNVGYDEEYLSNVVMLTQKQAMLIEMQRKYIKHLESGGADN
ncbi:hypothetical protein BNJ_00306 [Kaumoebavirus]|uniref:hypothetical protein n=1 Tax=Kaumoebavirus TaxID=1859492 RepID=UPI0009C1EC5C|nr:hypothetical protein BNJ_00306 [Kaumoebavirus]ARA72128.1 hypothetical protein BNJ_00306 [Kaumoebavirus]